MIRVTWKDPNFLAELTDQNDVPFEEIHSADSEQALREALQKRVAEGEIKAIRGVRVFAFDDWHKRAKKATEAATLAHQTGAKYEFNSDIWKTLKPHLIRLFNGKCAYCEADFIAVAWGDVEHFRPKGKVTELDGTEVQVSGSPHPGYYWLAYNPANLMPSCQPCNQAWGKMNRFPIAASGKRAAGPADALDQEQALLLSAYDAAVDPLQHLKFSSKKSDPVPGLVQALTPAGEASIKAYHLNRPGLIKARATAQDAVLGQFALLFGSGGSFKAEKLEYVAGRRPYSAAVLTRIVRWEEESGIKIAT